MPVIKPTSLILIEKVANEVARQCPSNFDIMVDADLCGQTGAYYFFTDNKMRVAWVTVHRVTGGILLWFAKIPEEVDLTSHQHSRRPGPKIYQYSDNGCVEGCAHKYDFKQAEDLADEDQYVRDAAELTIKWLIEGVRPQYV